MHGSGTPFDTNKYESACVVCHMATQAIENGNQVSSAVHLWRINTDASYDTFPTTGQFYGGTCSVHTGAVQNAPYLPVVYLSDTSSSNCTAASGTWTDVTKDRNAQTASEGTYANAVWVDLDLACGQCHGGGSNSSTNPPEDGVVYLPKVALGSAVQGMHLSDWTAVTTGQITVNVKTYNGDPIQAAKVNLWMKKVSGWVQIKSDYTNASGSTIFDALKLGKKYKVVVIKSGVDFNGAVTGIQTKVKFGNTDPVTAPIKLITNTTINVQQGTPATNGSGDNGSRPTITITMP